MNWLRRIFCRHRSIEFVRNIYGDEINSWGGNRSLWTCAGCAAVVAHDGLHSAESAADHEGAPDADPS